MNTHANVVFNATCYQQWMQLDSNDVVIGVAPFFHITGLIAHLAVAALAGMPIIMFYRFDSAETLRLIEKWHGSFTVAAITVYIALLNHPDIRTRNLSSFRKAYSGGAPVSPTIVENFEKITGAYIHNIYGLTETTSPSHAVPLGVRAPVRSRFWRIICGSTNSEHNLSCCRCSHRSGPPTWRGRRIDYQRT